MLIKNPQDHKIFEKFYSYWNHLNSNTQWVALAVIFRMNSSCKHPQPTFKFAVFFLSRCHDESHGMSAMKLCLPTTQKSVHWTLDRLLWPFFHRTLCLYPISKNLLFQSVSLYYKYKRECGVEKRPWTFRHHKNFKLQQTPIDRRVESSECEKKKKKTSFCILETRHERDGR